LRNYIKTGVSFAHGDYITTFGGKVSREKCLERYLLTLRHIESKRIKVSSAKPHQSNNKKGDSAGRAKIFVGLSGVETWKNGEADSPIKAAP